MYRLNSFSNLTKIFSTARKTKIKNFLLLQNLNKVRFNSIHHTLNRNFTTKENENEDGIHSDFLPKVKQEITDENVLRVIDEWVKNNDVVLFMKGTREMPRCGFSNYVVQILNFYKIKNVMTVNILENPLVREAGKKYSNWPTYPQLYVKGNLIGGCDILKEMHENGALKDLVEREGIASL